MRVEKVIGVDPGPVPGFVVLTLQRHEILAVDVLQCTHRIAPGVFTGLLFDHASTVVAVEQFVVGRRAGRSRSAHAGALTRELIGRIQSACDTSPTPTAVYLRAAGQVKPWATDARLEAVGLLEATKGMRHAKDAARHAIFAAVHDGGVTDPLSKTESR